MIIFKNTGAIDLRAISTFGLSSKADQNKIGRFGTGLKYATAVIARNGGKLSIWADGQWNTTGTRTENFRDQEVEQLTLNGADLPFTTDLGRDWEIWMAFRELYSNALDEEGAVERGEGLPEPSDDQTIIAVELDAFEAIYFTMEEHFIGNDESPIFESDEIQVFPGRSKFLFYRGIAIQKLKKPAAYRYNLKGYVDLTEDRTAKYSWQTGAKIARALIGCTDPEIVKAACDQRNEYEAGIDFSEVNKKPSQEFLGAAVELGANCNPSARAIVRAQLPADCDAATILQKGAPGAEALSAALVTLREIGADLSKAKFVLAEGLTLIADFDVRGDAVFLSERIFNDPDRMTIAVIKGYDAIEGKNWLVKRAIDLSTATSTAAE